MVKSSIGVEGANMPLAEANKSWAHADSLVVYSHRRDTPIAIENHKPSASDVKR